MLLLLPAALLAQNSAFALPTGDQESALARETADFILHGQTQAALQRFTAYAQAHGPAGVSAEVTLTQTSWHPQEAVLLAEALAASGQYTQARQILEPIALARGVALPVALAYVSLQKACSTLNERLKSVQKIVANATASGQGSEPRLLVALGEALIEAGKNVEARRILDPLADRYEAEAFHEPLDLVAVADSLADNGYVRDAAKVYQQAAQAAAEPEEQVVVELHYAQLLMTKNNWRDADTALGKVLAINPHHGQAIAAMAQIDVQSDHDIAKARGRVDAALRDNPNHLELLTVRAEIAMHDEDFPAAYGYLQRAQAVRSDAQEVLWDLGALAQLTDNQSLWQQVVKQSLPGDGRLWLTAATWLEQNHRYREVMILLRQALARQPDLARAHAALGFSYARVADDVQARKEFDVAERSDPFHVPTHNQLDVLYDGVLKQMVILQGKNVNLRIHRKDRKALEPTVMPFLQAAVDGLSRKYGFSPEKPLQVEIFPEVEQFSVRTVGLPQLGAHAVCFGHLITSRSPIEQPFNWKMVLQHELSHVYHIQAADGRMPRWLTEGLAMMESSWANPRWQMHLDRQAWQRWKSGKLATIEQFNLAFTQARSLDDIVQAYYQASLLVEFLHQTYGFDKIRTLVASYAKGGTTDSHLLAIFGQSAQALDQQFLAWLPQRLGRYDRDFRFDSEMLTRKTPEPSQAVTGEPIRAAWQQTAEALRHGQVAAAQESLRALLTLEPSDNKELCKVNALLMDLARTTKDTAQAVQAAERLIAFAGGQCDGSLQRFVRALALKNQGKLSESMADIRKASEFDPEDGGPQALVLEFAQHALTQWQAQVKAGKTVVDKQDWLGAFAPARSLRAVAHAVASVVNAQANDPHPPKLLGEIAWAEWQTTPSPAAAADLALAADALTETEPGHGDAWLASARAEVAAGKPEVAITSYRLSAQAAQGAAQRRVAWCEAESAAAKANRPEEQAEAKRHCQAAGSDSPAPTGDPP